MNDLTTNQNAQKPGRITGRRTKVLFYTLTLSFLVISLLFFGLGAVKPSMGIALSLEDEGWVVQSVDPSGTAERAGIEVGDRPEVINGQEAQLFLQDYQEEGLVLGYLMQELTVINNDGQLKTVSADSSPTLQSIIEVATCLFVSLIFWIAGFFVYFKRPENMSALLLCLCGLAFGLALSANIAGERFGVSSIAIHIAVIATTIGPWLLLHFFLALPEERAGLRNNPLVYLIYLPAVITIILYFTIGFADGQPVQDFRAVRFFGLGVGFLAVAVVAVLNYARAASLKTRQQMKIILIGCLAAIIPFAGLSVLPAAAEGHNVMPASFSILFVSFIPLSMGYAIITRRLLDIEIIIRRGAVYGLVTIFMAIILVAAISLFLVLGESAGIFERMVVALVLGSLATILFGPVKGWVENIIDKLFFKDRYDYRATIKELSDSLNRLNDVEAASSIITGTLMNALKIDGACLIIETEREGLHVSAAQGIFRGSHKEEQLSKIVSQQGTDILEFPILASKTDPDIAYIVPLMVGDRKIGFLCLSHKKTGQDYSPSDIYLIQDLAVVAAVSLRSMLVIANDIIERKLAAEALKHAAEEWRTTFDSITDMIVIVGADNNIIRVNKAFAQALNIEPKKIIGKNRHEIANISPGSHPLCDIDPDLDTKQSYTHEIFEPELGKYFECTMSPLLDDNGNVTGAVYISKDITQRKEMEAEQKALRTKAEISSRLASVGEMAAGIAHEINNPLTGVIGFSQILLDEDLPPNIKEQVKIIAEGSKRVKEIVKRMLTFARQSKPYKTNINIHELIDNTLELRRYVLKTANIEVVKHYDATLSWVTVDPGQLQQVFINIIVNAEYAMKKAHDGGTLTITTKKKGEDIYISFQDDGPGISEENLQKIFSPFFTTKDPGEGTGLGLSLSRSIILEHNGTIESESKPGKGTAFIIKLPVVPQPDESKPESHAETSTKNVGSQKTSALIVDDEPVVRTLVKRFLESDGHIISEAETPAQALDMLLDNKYNIIFLDMRMPGMSGKELYAEIENKWPDMARRAIFITGDTADATTQQFLAEHNLPFITKPFDRATLLSKVSELLGR